MMSSAGDDRWRTHRGQPQHQQQQQPSTASHERSAGGTSHQPQVIQTRQGGGGTGLSVVSGNAWAGGDRAVRGPLSSGMAEDQHIPVGQFNARETREILRKGYVDAINSEAKPTTYKEAGNAKSGGPWASKPNAMASGQDFFVQLRKQTAALQHEDSNKITQAGG